MDPQEKAAPKKVKGVEVDFLEEVVSGAASRCKRMPKPSSIRTMRSFMPFMKPAQNSWSTLLGTASVLPGDGPRSQSISERD